MEFTEKRVPGCCPKCIENGGKPLPGHSTCVKTSPKLAAAVKKGMGQVISRGATHTVEVRVPVR